MLLPGLEGEDVGPAAVVVGGLPHDAAGELPGEGGGGRHEAQVGSAEAQGHAQGLPLAHGDVGAALPRGLEDRHGDGVDPHDEFGTGGVGGLPQLLCRLDTAIVVGLLEVETGHGVVQQVRKGLGVGEAVLHGDGLHLHAVSEAVGLHRPADHGVGGGGEQHRAPLPVPAHGRRLGGGGGAVVDGGVGGVHAGEGADHGLVLKDGLEHPLGELGLVGGVGGEEGLLAGDALDDGGDVVPVGPRPPEHRGKDGILGGDALQDAPDLQLALAVGQVQMVQPHLLRHLGEEVVHALAADGLQHGPALPVGGWQIASHVLRSAPFRGWVWAHSS